MPAGAQFCAEPVDTLPHLEQNKHRKKWQPNRAFEEVLLPNMLLPSCSRRFLTLRALVEKESP